MTDIEPTEIAIHLVERALALIDGDRAAQYGDAKEMHGKIAASWSQLFGVPIRPDSVAVAMALLKYARLSHDAGHADSYVDLIGYAILAEHIVSGESKADLAAAAIGHLMSEPVAGISNPETNGALAIAWHAWNLARTILAAPEPAIARVLAALGLTQGAGKCRP